MGVCGLVDDDQYDMEMMEEVSNRDYPTSADGLYIFIASIFRGMLWKMKCMAWNWKMIFHEGEGVGDENGGSLKCSGVFFPFQS